jgi:hypothetical protein
MNETNDMNEPNELETELRTWALRRPSAKLKRRLFARRPVESPVAFSLSWLAPATAALLMVGMLLNQRHNPLLFEPGKSGPMVAMILSNQNAAASLPAGFESQQNGLPADFLRWANGSRPAAHASRFATKPN